MTVAEGKPGAEMSPGGWWRMRNLSRYQGNQIGKMGDSSYTNLAGFLPKLDNVDMNTEV